MDAKILQDKKTRLLKKLTTYCETVIPGSMNEQKVNCGGINCKKCKDNQKGHVAWHISYYQKDSIRKNVYAPINKIKEIKKAQSMFLEAKLILSEIAEINLQLLKSRPKK